ELHRRIGVDVPKADVVALFGENEPHAVVGNAAKLGPRFAVPPARQKSFARERFRFLGTKPAIPDRALALALPSGHLQEQPDLQVAFLALSELHVTRSRAAPAILSRLNLRHDRLLFFCWFLFQNGTA